jgi:hypothetical protein
MFNVVGSFLVTNKFQESFKADQSLETAGLKQFEDMAYCPDVKEEGLFYDQLTERLNLLQMNDVQAFVAALGTLDFQSNEILQHPDLPYLAMDALRKGLIDPLQAATALNFWSALRYHGSPNDLQTIEIFHRGAPNEEAISLMKQTFATGSVPFLDGPKFQTFMDNMLLLPPSEQRFLLVPDIQGDASLSTIARQNGGDHFKATISQVVKDLEINVFNRVQPKMRMVPSVGMMQAFLNAQYEEPIEIKPKIYLSTAMQIRQCGLDDTRDMMMPFPDAPEALGNSRCPQKADGHQAPWYEFPYHDFYHAILASAIGKDFRRAAIAAADVVAAYANEPGTENREGLLQLSSSLIDMDFNHFIHFLRDPKTSTAQLFWDTLVLKVEEINQTFEMIRQFERRGLPIPFEASPISDENITTVLEKIYHALAK